MKTPPTRLGFGMAAIGRPLYINLRTESTTKFSPEFEYDQFLLAGKKMLTQAYQAGIRYFDTAPGYGMAEKILASWINENAPQNLTIASKWGYTYTANFQPDATSHEVKEHSLQKLNLQWKQTQQALPSTAIYQIHSATFESGVLENYEVLQRLLELKKENDLLIGLSTTGDNQAEVLAHALQLQVKGEELFDAFQVSYNILDQSLVELIRQGDGAGKRIIIKEALANGRLLPNQQYSHYQTVYDLVSKLAHKYRVAADAIALRFCLDSLPSFQVLSGASTHKQLEGNLKALNFQLTAQEITQLRGLAISPSNYWAERKKLVWQ